MANPALTFHNWRPSKSVDRRFWLHKTWRSADFEVLKLWSVRSGCEQIFLNLTKHFWIFEPHNPPIDCFSEAQTCGLVDFYAVKLSKIRSGISIGKSCSLSCLILGSPIKSGVDKIVEGSRPNVSHFCGLKNTSIEAWGSQATSIEALVSQTRHKNNCFSVKAKFKLFFRQTSLRQNVKHLVGLGGLFTQSSTLKRKENSTDASDLRCNTSKLHCAVDWPSS